MTTFEQALQDAYGTPEQWERERTLRLRAATTSCRCGPAPRHVDRGSHRARHVDMVSRMIAHPERPVTVYTRGRCAVTIQRGAHVTHAASPPRDPFLAP